MQPRAAPGGRARVGAPRPRARDAALRDLRRGAPRGGGRRAPPPRDGGGVLRLLAAAAARLEGGAERLPARLGRVLPALPPLAAARHLAPADPDAALPVVPSGAWAALWEAVGAAAAADGDGADDDGAAWRVPVVVAAPRGAAGPHAATTCTVVLRHWRRGADGALAHRGLATCALRARPALGGLCVEPRCATAPPTRRGRRGGWTPRRASSRARRAPPRRGGARARRGRAPRRQARVGRDRRRGRRGGGARGGVGGRDGRAPQRRAAVAPRGGGPPVRAPVLEAAVPLDLADDAGGATADGALVARRLATEAAMRDAAAGVHGLLASGIGRDFADDVVAGALASRGKVGVYAVHARGEAAAVAAFSVVLFRCAPADADGDGPEVALLVQSIAVADAAQERGVGSAVFREPAGRSPRGAPRAAPSSGSACGRAARSASGAAPRRLGAARALVLQAVALEPAFIRLETQCTPRAREYRRPGGGT